MIYYYFTLAFCLLASWAVSGMLCTYSDELLLKRYITVKNGTALRLLKITDKTDTDRKENQENRSKVTVIGLVSKLLWLLGIILSIIILFALPDTPAPKEHTTALVMPAVLTTVNQKAAHYINLAILALTASLCIINSVKLLYKSESESKKRTEFVIRILWAAVGAAFFALFVYLVIICIQLFAFI